MSEQEESLITQLILSIQEQAAAIQSLADSNNQLVSAMMEAMAEDDEDEAGTFGHLGQTL